MDDIVCVSVFFRGWCGLYASAVALQSIWRGNLALQGSRLKLIMVIWWIAPNYRLGHDSRKCAQLKMERMRNPSLFFFALPFHSHALMLIIYLSYSDLFFLLFFLSWTLPLSSFLSYFFGWCTLICFFVFLFFFSVL